MSSAARFPAESDDMATDRAALHHVWATAGVLAAGIA